MKTLNAQDQVGEAIECFDSDWGERIRVKYGRELGKVVIEVKDQIFSFELDALVKKFQVSVGNVMGKTVLLCTRRRSV